MFKEIRPEVTAFIEKSRKERDERRDARVKATSAVIIQKYWRGFTERKKVKKYLRSQFDATVRFDSNTFKQPEKLIPALDLLRVFRCLKFKYCHTNDASRFELLIRYIIYSIETGNPEFSYVSLALRKTTLLDWISTTKWIFATLLDGFDHLDPCNPNDSKSLNLYLSFLLIITNFSQWALTQAEPVKPAMNQLISVFVQNLVQNKLFQNLHSVLQKGLARHSPALTKVSLTGIFTIAMRPLIINNFKQDLVILFASQILSVPGFVLHINSMMNEAYDIIVKERLCSKIVLALHSSSSEFGDLLSQLEGSYVLCFIANLIQLSLLEGEVLAMHCTEFCIVISKLMNFLSIYVGSKSSNVSSWHPILGWFAHSLDNSLQSAMQSVTSQLALLWIGRMVRLLFADLYAQAELSLQDSDHKSNNSLPSNLPTGPGLPSKAEKLGTVGLLPPFHRNPSHGSRSHDSDGYTSRVRHGLSQFLRQLSAAAPIRSKVSSVKKDKSAANGSRNLTPGPSELPRSLKAVCMLYCFTSNSLREIRNDILAGLSLGDLLPRMWRLISCCGSARDWAFVLIGSGNSSPLDPHEYHLMQIFAAAATNLLSIVDDVELFELKKSFTLEELCAMGTFFNHLIYESALMVSNPDQLLPASVTSSNPTSVIGITTKTGQVNVDSHHPSGSTISDLFCICLRLLSVIHERDSRTGFAPPDAWLISNLKISAFLSDLRKPKPHAKFLLKHVPHIIPHKERVLLFRELVREDKASRGVVTRSSWLTDDGPVGAVITIHRNRIVEDGYQQLANLTSEQLRMKIRVQFVNEMGLDEVGIDLDGVFKEFLEETLRRVFDPSLNLFRLTSDQRLYPSPTSHLQESHLLLFEFLGKMLAKAVYESIVVDVPFANFFLTQLLGREKADCYSFLDELATLDRELYKSLSYIKHYDGDVSDLGFTYSYAEDCLGQIVVHDLCPGGRHVPVTNDLKISYVHRVARFRMYKQIRSQTESFIRGFYSILNPDWLAMFSPPELQKLISGDSGSVDIEDLKQHTRYSGGFHSNHRVIRWLWDILRHDFDDRERGLFLKFVTSCSRPPLLGFCNLEPPFCIRCVQYTNEDMDVGDTLGSVLKGFFGVVGRREEVSRLPTASTCFNLLKLPNYSSRGTLRDKLRYAINSHAGFELS